jgi:hypothetical protein
VARAATQGPRRPCRCLRHFDFDQSAGQRARYFTFSRVKEAAMTAPAERQPVYLYEMMERLGIEPGGGVVPRLSLTYATALHRCEACRSKQACRDWLDSMPGSVAFAPWFCANGDTLFELQVDQPGFAKRRTCLAT